MHHQIVSKEQAGIVHSLVHENTNVVVDAVAGSGKTTTSRFVVDEWHKKYPTSKILMLTYSRRLKDDAEEKLSAYDCAHVHTFHSFAGKQYYSSTSACHDDVVMTHLIRNNKGVSLVSSLYSLIIVDEVQDMTPLYFQLVAKTIRDHISQNITPRLLILGDCQQSIYGFQGADSRYLKYAPDIWQKVPGFDTWKQLTLHQSFRVPKSVANFVNLLTGVSDIPRMVSEKKDVVQPRYVLCNIHNPLMLYQEVQKCLEIFDPEDIFILSPSVRGSKIAPIKKMANMLAEFSVPLCVTTNDSEVLTPAIMRGKLVITTFHQSKGLERNAVIVVGLDASYFKYFDDQANSTILSNTGYVAFTRAMKSLVIIQNSNENPMECVKLAEHKLHTICNIVQLQDSTSFEADEIPLLSIPDVPPRKERISQSKGKDVCDSLRFLPSDVSIAQLQKLNIIIEKQATKLLEVNETTMSTAANPEDGKGDTQESVSEITGVAIPIDYQLHMDIPLGSDCEAFFLFQEMDDDLRKRNKTWSTEQLLKMTTAYCADRSALLYKKAQISEYNWLSDDTRNLSLQRMKDLNLSTDTQYEVLFGITLENGKDIIRGVADAIDNSIIYEFKFVSALTTEHVLQLICYMYLYHQTHRRSDTDTVEGVLYNIRSDEKWCITTTGTILKSIWEAIHTPYSLENTMSDFEFIQYCQKMLS